MKLADWMEKEGLSAAQMAGILGCSEAVVHSYRRGSSFPNLRIFARIKKATAGEVQVEDFIDLDGLQLGRAEDVKGALNFPTPAHLEGWLKTRGIKALSLLLAQVPGGPHRGILERAMRRDPRPRWKVYGRGGRASVWVGSTGQEVSDAYRIVMALRGHGPLSFFVERAD